MVTTILLVLWLAMVVAPETPVAHALRTWLVDRPAAWLARITRGHVVMMTAAVLLTVAAAWVLGDEVIGVLGMGAPDFAAALMAFDVATYVDVAVAALLLSSAMPLRGVATRIAAVARRQCARRRRVRTRPGAVRRASNDDEEERLRIAA